MTSQAILPGAISREQRAEGVDLLPERRLLLVLLRLLHVGLDLANLGAHAGGGDDADGGAVRDSGPGEHHVELRLWRKEDGDS